MLKCINKLANKLDKNKCYAKFQMPSIMARLSAGAHTQFIMRSRIFCSANAKAQREEAEIIAKSKHRTRETQRRPDRHPQDEIVLRAGD